MSTFPWSEFVGQHWFLMFSIPVSLGWCVQFISEIFAVLIINVATKLGAVLGLAGLILLTYYENRIFSSLILLFFNIIFMCYFVRGMRIE